MPDKIRYYPDECLPRLAPGLVDAERLADLRAEPDAWLTAGQLAQLSDSFACLAEELRATAIAKVKPQIEGMLSASDTIKDAGVEFKWNAPKETVIVNTAAVKEEHPPETAPHLYKKSQRSASISIRL